MTCFVQDHNAMAQKSKADNGGRDAFVENEEQEFKKN